MMRKAFWAIAFVAMLLATQTVRARAQDNAVYAVTYLEVMPNAVDAALAVLDRYGSAGREEQGGLRLDLLHEIARPERFAIMEVWKDRASLEAHDSAADASQFRDSLKSIRSAPADKRIGNGLFVGPVASAGPAVPADTVFVLTHVDVTPDHKEDASTLLEGMRTNSIREQGNIRYDVLQQVGRLNHFTVVEEWASLTALDAHIMAQNTRAFRQALMPMEGALYDERRYKSLH